MGIAAAIHQSGTGPSSCEDLENLGGLDRRTRERFPWEHGSTRDMWRGRIGALLTGAVLTSLVVLSNARTITALEGGMLAFNGGGLQTAHASAQRLQPVQPEMTPTPSVTPAPPVSQPQDPDPALVQFGSFSSEAEALAATVNMSSRYGSILKGRKLTISAATVRQVHYHRVVLRLQSEREARDLCSAVQNQKGDCLVWTADAIRNAKG